MAKAICKVCPTEFEFSPAHKRVYCGRQCYENFLKNNGTRKGVKLSEETKTKMRLASLGEKNHRFGKKTTEETKKKISESNKGKHRYWKGKKQPAEMIAKRAEKLLIKRLSSSCVAKIASIAIFVQNSKGVCTDSKTFCSINALKY